MLNKSFLKKMKDNLLYQKQDLLAKAKQKVDIDVDGDETDEIQGKMLIELNAHLSIRDGTKILQINDALNKIENSTYGLCQDCGENIPEKRLMINPHFLTCITCAEEREHEAKQRKRF